MTEADGSAEPALTATADQHPEPPLRVGFACVTENRLDWAHKAHNLALSVRALGGSAAEAPIVVNVVEGIDDAFRDLLDGLDVILQAVDRFDRRFPHANKLRMFEDLTSFSACDVLVALDCDIVLVDDPADLLSATHIRAKAEDQTILTEHHWLAVYEQFGIDPPAMDCVMTSSGEATYPWWNSGVVHVPLPLVEALRSRWAENVLKVGRIHEELPQLLPATWITDQTAFALTLLELGLPFDPLSIWGNVPTCFPIKEEFLEAAPGRPIFVHYHHHLTRSGFLRMSGLPVIDERLETVNRLRSDRLALPYQSLAELETPRSRPVRAWAKLQSRLKHKRWYRSAPAQKAKRLLVNFDQRRKA